MIKNKAKQMHAKVTFVNSAGIRVLQESLNGESFSYRSSDGRWYEKIEIPLLGRHQINNAALALETLNVIKTIIVSVIFRRKTECEKQSGEVELRYWNENLW